MALNFFDYAQLSEGINVGEQIEKANSAKNRGNNVANITKKNTSNLRINVPELQRLHSETSSTHRMAPTSPLTPRSSRPATSHRVGPEQDARPTTSSGRFWDKRPNTSHSTHTSAAPEKSSFTQSIAASLNRQRSTAKSRDGRQQEEASRAEEKISKDPSLYHAETAVVSRPKTVSTQPKKPQRARSKSGTLRRKSSNLLQKINNLAATAPPLPQPIHPQLRLRPAMQEKQAKFLAESLAHVTVGEWLFKDPGNPSWIPRTNIFKKQSGPAPRGSTGLPQKRWFRISPFDRTVGWSGKWETSSTSQAKASRQVPVNLVFEAPCNTLLRDCLPIAMIPFNKSIVIIAPERMLKITAPDEERHNLWLTALQFIADSTVKLDEENWASEMRACFSALTLNSSMDMGPRPQASNYFAKSDARQRVLNVDKSLPPSPPIGTTMTPPPVPRFRKHVRQPSDGVSSVADGDVEKRQEEDPETPKAAPSQKPESEPPLLEVATHESAASNTDPEAKRDSRLLASDEFAMDQMEMLVDRLAKI